ncbi:MAG: ATP-binding domain-containing protein, partial [Bacteroidales bacterium]|nr:ATP-binding domain-containing protein [Bacteroidales bacterium]
AELNIPVWNIINEAEKFSTYFASATAKKLMSYADLINTLSLGKEETDAYSKAREIAFGSGIMKELRDGKMPEEISRYENMEELLNAIKAFTEASETNGEPATLEAYMATVALLTDQDNEKEEDRDKVTLMTMHSAKGLEFCYVYIVGMEDTLFPSPLSAGSSKELEEERRLFYVALTRAKKQAMLSYALNRYKWGNLERSNPSRFLREVDPKYLHYPQTGGKPFRNGTADKEKPDRFREEPVHFTPPPRLRKFRTDSEPNTRISPVTNGITMSDFSEGDSVVHERFGQGIIVSIDGEAPNKTASVEFEDSGRKKLLLRFAKLRKV